MVQKSTHNTAQSFANLAKCLSLHLRTNWFCVRIPLLSLKLQIWRLLRARSFFTFRQTMVCRFTLKLVWYMVITYIQLHRTDMLSRHSSIIWPAWLNGWVFDYEQTIVCRFTLKLVCDMIIAYSQVKPILSIKFVNSEKITLIDSEKIIINDKEIAKVLYDFFSSIIKTLNMPIILAQ